MEDTLPGQAVPGPSRTSSSWTRTHSHMRNSPKRCSNTSVPHLTPRSTRLPKRRPCCTRSNRVHVLY
ncbi:hypothetical protein GQ600_13037 [Phytophthora cactorum]|nr:hypothetical protein GQ600_13037 [Phytophthora cactorum]